MLPENYTEWKKCYFCGDDYQQKNNIGFLRCRVHPGIKLIGDFNTTYYSCCGAIIIARNVYYKNQFTNLPIYTKEDKMGCLEIDHFCQDELLEKGILYSSNKRIKNDYDDIKTFSSNFNEKIEQIKSLCFMIVPDLLYQKGLFKPIYTNTILQKFEYSDIENIEKHVKENMLNFGNNSFNIKYNLNIQSNSLKGYFYNKDYFKNSTSIHKNEVFYIENNTKDKDNIEIDVLQIIQSLKEEILSSTQNDINMNEYWQDNLTNEIIDNENSLNDQPINFSFYIISRIGNSLLYDCSK